jgi:NAD(P)-dependent dehydrogenase (short-subunit alcohol dehydrogenase family)
VIADVNIEQARATADELASSGLDVRAVECDVTNVAQVRSVMADVDQEVPLGTVVCDAGIGFMSPFIDVDEAAYDRLMAVNVKGLFFVMQAALRQMLPRRFGSIVNVSSTSGFMASTQPMAPYDASKAAVRMITTAAAREFAPKGIRVNAVAPGTVGTDLLHEVMTPERVAKLIETHIPLGRLGDPDDIADAVCFLSSPQAAYITGHTLVVDGGWLT